MKTPDQNGEMEVLVPYKRTYKKHLCGLRLQKCYILYVFF
ncbi:hypothetical protein HMPREF3293_01100 [Christensenella minuta]|uniref:Uncharacterized protein n=1 Tax=Christensenella minuta TaxID=626937 RepID=A0A136Q601_9FIRM|nr:hypothetical protein HMPREF3293_01100 [Christensenella minuta]